MRRLIAYLKIGRFKEIFSFNLIVYLPSLRKKKNTVTNRSVFSLLPLSALFRGVFTQSDLTLPFYNNPFFKKKDISSAFLDFLYFCFWVMRNPSNSRVMPSESPRFRTQSTSFPWKQAERMSYPVLENQLKDKQRSRPITADCHYSSFRSNQFRGSSSLQVPMFHPDQFKRRSTEPARLLDSHGLRRYQPY